MKWIITFLGGALVGGVGIFIYLDSFASHVVPVVASSPTVTVPALPCIPIAPVPTPQPGTIEMPASEPATVPSPATAPVSPTPAAAGTVPVANQLLIPVAGITASALKDTFNETRGTERHHEAIDILAPKGTQVFAVADGKIAKLFNSKPGGLTVYQFDTSEKFAYYYAHLDRYAADIKEGMILKRGDLVGYVGTSGNADPQTPHLHFTIFALGPEKQWWKGTPVNPYPLLGGAPHP